MQTRAIVVGICLLGWLVAPPVAETQESGRTYQIGLLSIVPEPKDQALPLYSGAVITKAFLAELRASGYVEGDNLVFERRFADGKVGRLPELAAELVTLDPDVILTESTPATRAAQKATGEIPIVFNIGADPVTEGFVASLARPGGNITGFRWTSPTTLKRLQILQEVVPDLKQVAYLCPTEELDRCTPDQELLDAAGRMGLTIQTYDVAAPEDFDAFFKAAADGAGAVLIQDMAWFYGYIKELGEAAGGSPLPSVFPATGFAEAGGLLSYEADNAHAGERTATIVVRILEGHDPAEIPVEHPTVFDIRLNLKTARTWDIELPASLLMRATHVIE